MVTITFALKPYLARYMYVRYGDRDGDESGTLLVPAG